MAWNKLSSSGRVFNTAAWFEINASAVGPRNWFVMVHDQGRPLALCPVFLHTQPASYAYFDFWRIVSGATLFGGDIAPPPIMDWQPHLVVGVPYGYCSPVLIASELANAERQDVVDTLLDSLSDLARREGAAYIGFLYMPQEDQFLADLNGRGIRSGVIMADSVLHLANRTWEEYLQSLGGHRRRRILAEIRASNKQAIRVSLETPGSDTPRLLAQMEVELFNKYAQQGDVLVWEAWYTKLLVLLGPKVRLYLCWKGEEAAGYSLFLTEGDTWVAKATGYRYGLLSPRDYAYFVTVYYEPVRDAISHGVAEIQYGAAAYDAKLLRGCKLKPLCGAVLPVSREAESMVAVLADYQTVLNARLHQISQAHDNALEGVFT
jgi:predicted N-acyltransferase